MGVVVELIEFMIASPSVPHVCRPVELGNIELGERDLSDDEGGAVVAYVDPFNKQLSFCSSE
jgi:hypothetical protein